MALSTGNSQRAFDGCRQPDPSTDVVTDNADLLRTVTPTTWAHRPTARRACGHHLEGSDSVIAYTFDMADRDIVHQLNDQLRGSPYALPANEFRVKRAESLLEECESIESRQRSVQLEFAVQREEPRERVESMIRVREVYESNHCYFQGSYKRLRAASKSDVDEDTWATRLRTGSRPFAKPATGKFAVKVINDYGDEVVEVSEV